VLLPVFHLANLGAIENVSAFVAARESETRRLRGIAAEALHKHDLMVRLAGVMEDTTAVKIRSREGLLGNIDGGCMCLASFL
jgi:hypothetical protein